MPRVSIENLKDLNPLSGYKLTDKVSALGGDYYGYINSEGQWFIMYDTGGEVTYVKGDTGYATNWTNRAILTYATYDVVF